MCRKEERREREDEGRVTKEGGGGTKKKGGTRKKEEGRGMKEEEGERRERGKSVTSRDLYWTTMEMMGLMKERRKEKEECSRT